MSKFLDKIKKLSQPTVEPMGFRHSKTPVEKSRLFIVAGIKQADMPDLADALIGADAVIIQSDKAVKKNKALADIPRGCRVENIAVETLNKLADDGCDFVVLPDSAAPIPGESKPSRILEVEISLSEGLIRALEDIPVDAILVGYHPEMPFDWRYLMMLDRFTALSKPLMVGVNSNATAEQLQILWELGIDAVVVEVREGSTIIKKLRDDCDKLPGSPSRRKKRGGKFMPTMGPARALSEDSPEPEEEEEGEDE